MLKANASTQVAASMVLSGTASNHGEEQFMEVKRCTWLKCCWGTSHGLHCTMLTVGVPAVEVHLHAGGPHCSVRHLHRQRGVGKVVVNTAFLSLSGMSGRVHQSKSREASPTRTCRTCTEHCCQVPKLFSDQYIKKVRLIWEKSSSNFTKTSMQRSLFNKKWKLKCYFVSECLSLLQSKELH